jgi:DNA polymerase-3 subunit delta
MLNPWRFILVKEADRFSPGDIDQFLPYIEGPSPSTCLVLWGDTGGPWKQFFPKIRAVGAVIQIKSFFAGKLIGWIKREAQACGKGMTREAAAYLKDMVGNRLRDLHNEIEKTVAYVGEKPVIELEDVEGVVSEVRTRTIFELTDAIGTRNSLEALRILRRMLQAGEDVAGRRSPSQDPQYDCSPISFDLEGAGPGIKGGWKGGVGEKVEAPPFLSGVHPRADRQFQRG